MHNQHSSSKNDAPFTPYAQHALVFVGDTAVQLQHAHISTEHLLLGVVQDERIAALLGVTSDAVQHALEAMLRNNVHSMPSLLMMDADARRSVTRAMDEAQRRHDDAVDTPHLLLALLADDTNGAVKMLIHLGVSIEHVRVNIEKLLNHQDAEDAEQPGCRSIGLHRVPFG